MVSAEDEVVEDPSPSICANWADPRRTDVIF